MSAPPGARTLLRGATRVTAGACLASVALVAQSPPAGLTPLRTTPVAAVTVAAGFRDWSESVVTGTTIIAGTPNGAGGLYAADTTTGKLRWTFRPAGTPRSPHVMTRPAVSGDTAIVPIGTTVIGVSVATGRERWRGPTAADGASVAADGRFAYVAGDDGTFHALDVATGQDRWTKSFARAGSCASQPVVHDGVVFVTATVVVTPADATRAARYYQHLFALDAATGQERWRYPAAPLGSTSGVCFTQPVPSGDTFFMVGEHTLHAITRATGREAWTPVEVRLPVEDRVRAVDVGGLVDAGSTVVGITPGALVAFDKATGRIAWQIAGQYRATRPSTAVVGRVLYFQGHAGATPSYAGPAGTVRYAGGRPIVEVPRLPDGNLNALDLDTRAVLWSFSRPTSEPNWSFGTVTPGDRGLWVDSYGALIKLQ